MKKLYLTLSWLCALCHAQAQTQYVMDRSSRLYYDTTYHDVDTTHYKYKTIIWPAYDSVLQTWPYDTAYSYVYSSSPAQVKYRQWREFDTQKRIVTDQREEMMNNNWELWEVARYTYTPAGKIATEWRYKPATQVDSIRYFYTYNAQGQLAEREHQVWDYNTNSWPPGETDTYTYDASGREILMVQKGWNTITQQWVDGLKITTDYHPGTTERILQTYANNTWGNAFRYVDYFTTPGQVETKENFEWYNGAWKPVAQQSLYYNQSGKIDSIVRRDWNGSFYGNRDMTAYEYYAHLLVTREKKWDADSSKFIVKNFCSELRDYYMWEGKVNDYATPQPPTLTVYPVPATNTVHITANVQGSSPAFLYITGMNGRIVKRVPVSVLAGEVNELVDVSALPKGTYIITLNATGIQTAQKVTIE